MARVTIVIEDVESEIVTDFQSVPPVDISDEGVLTQAQLIGTTLMEFAVRHAKMTGGVIRSRVDEKPQC